MLKLSKLAFCMSAAIALVACGGGGGGSGSDSEPATPTNPEVVDTSTSYIPVLLYVDDGSSVTTQADDSNSYQLCVAKVNAANCDNALDKTDVTVTTGKSSSLKTLTWKNSTYSKSDLANYEVIAYNNNKATVDFKYGLGDISYSESNKNLSFKRLYLNALSTMQYISKQKGSDFKSQIGVESSVDFATENFEANDNYRVLAQTIVNADYIKNTDKSFNDVFNKLNNSIEKIEKILANNWNISDIISAGDSYLDQERFEQPKNAENPKASFDFVVSNTENYKVSFSNTSVDPQGAKLTYTWKFGDGSSSTTENPEHVYANSTARTVSLKVCNDYDLCSTEVRKTVTPKCVVDCSAPNQAPKADFDVVNNKGVFTITNKSSDPEGKTLKNSWTVLLNGAEVKTISNNAKAFTYEALQTGSYQFKLVTTDVEGLSDTKSSQSINVTCLGTACDEQPVQNTVPVADFTYSVKNGAVTFTNTSTDADGDTLKSTWNVGNGNGEFSRKDKSFTINYSKVGTYTVTLVVNDGKADSKVKTEKITITCVDENGCSEPVNHEPEAKIAVLSKSDLTVKFSNTSSDADKDDLTVEWSFGDGQTSKDTSASVTHTYSKAGTYDVFVKVSDGKATVKSDIVQVTVSSATPVEECTADAACSEKCPANCPNDLKCTLN